MVQPVAVISSLPSNAEQITTPLSDIVKRFAGIQALIQEIDSGGDFSDPLLQHRINVRQAPSLFAPALSAPSDRPVRSWVAMEKLILDKSRSVLPLMEKFIDTTVSSEQGALQIEIQENLNKLTGLVVEFEDIGCDVQALLQKLDAQISRLQNRKPTTHPLFYNYDKDPDGSRHLYLVAQVPI